MSEIIIDLMKVMFVTISFHSSIRWWLCWCSTISSKQKNMHLFKKLSLTKYITQRHLIINISFYLSFSNIFSNNSKYSYLSFIKKKYCNEVHWKQNLCWFSRIIDSSSKIKLNLEPNWFNLNTIITDQFDCAFHWNWFQM
jgi:hypothetical protein